MLKEHHLLRHEDEYLRTISAQLERYEYSDFIDANQVLPFRN